MDNRWRFLYCVPPELWGRMCEVQAGNEKTGTSGEAARPEKPPRNAVPRRGPKKSREVHGACAKKSRYGAARTRTVNRHRWMGRESQGRREKHC